MALQVKKRVFLVALPLVALAAAAYALLWNRRAKSNSLTLYGNVDIREVQLSFNDADRIIRMYVEEGDLVKPGQLLAELDSRRYAARVEEARHNVEVQKQILARLLAGSRPEEIRQARATMEALRASVRDAELTYRRMLKLRRGKVVPQQTLDDAEAKLKQARGNYEAARQAWILAVKGPRIEDIENARAALRAAQAALKLAERELADTKLYAPFAGIVEDRILEPGDMAAPNVPVFTIALTNPVWVRAYLPEPYLGRIHLGMKAAITTDSFPGRAFQGWIGYISPSAEFTPKNVETPELRTRLVYQVRVYACNPTNDLRLGMPATVTVALNQESSRTDQTSDHGCNSRNEGERELRKQ